MPEKMSGCPDFPRHLIPLNDGVGRPQTYLLPRPPGRLAVFACEVLAKIVRHAIEDVGQPRNEAGLRHPLAISIGDYPNLEEGISEALRDHQAG